MTGNDFLKDFAYGKKAEQFAQPYLYAYAETTGYEYRPDFGKLVPDFELSDAAGVRFICDVKAQRPHMDAICVELYSKNYGRKTWGFTYDRILIHYGKSDRWFWLDLRELRQRANLEDKSKHRIAEEKKEHGSHYIVTYFSVGTLIFWGCLNEVTEDVKAAHSRAHSAA